MAGRRKPTGVTYRQLKGTYIIEDKTHSNVVVISKLWKSAVERAEKIFNVILPKGPPPGGMCA